MYEREKNVWCNNNNNNKNNKTNNKKYTHPEDGPCPKIWNFQSFFRAAKRPCVVVRLKILKS